MANRRLPAPSEWLSFPCPFCKVNLRIKTAYAHLRGRCPECGFRIEPPTPRPSMPARFSSADEPVGLVPVDDEWPEAAQVDVEDALLGYDLSPDPVVWPDPAPPSAPDEGYSLSQRPLLPSTPLKESTAPAYHVLPPETDNLPIVSETFDPAHMEDLIPIPPPPPPRFPYWQGIYTFPWRLANISTWLFLGFFLFILAGLVALLVVLEEAGGIFELGVPLLIPMAGIVAFWIGIYGSNCFLAIVEETAAGSDSVAWPLGSAIGEGLEKLLYLTFIGGCSMIPVAIISVTVLNSSWMAGAWWVVSTVPWVVIFPIMLLSSLAANSRWMLLDGRIIIGFAKRPLAFLLATIPGLLLLIPCLGLGFLLLVRPNFVTALVTGLTWSTAVLMYGRVIGRAAWLISLGTIKPKRGATVEIDDSPPPEGQSEVLSGW